MPRVLSKHLVRIKCDCGEASCKAEDFVSYSSRGFASKQAKSVGWKRKVKHREPYWLAPGHRGPWERLPEP